MLQLTLARRGRTVYVEVDGTFVDPTTGQQSIDAAVPATNLYLRALLMQEPGLGRQLSREITRYRRSVTYPGV